MDQPGAKLKAEKIDLEIDEVHRPSDTQNLKI